jgi:CSLREA domain-containing protein
MVNTTVDENDAATGSPPSGPDGLLSLREAINAVNADSNSAADTIDFSLFQNGIATFSAAPYSGGFPAITRAVTINANPNHPNTDPVGDNAQITVQLNSALELEGAAANGSSIQGLALPELDVIGASNCTISGNFIGLMANGQPFSLPPPFRVGIFPDSSTSPSTLANHTIIGGNTLAARNVISAATNDDVSVGDSSDNQVLGNLMGTDLSGKAAAIVPAHSVGVAIYQVTETDPGGNQVLNNVIAFNGYSAVVITNSFENNIEQNSIFSNDTLGVQDQVPIDLLKGANHDLTPPALLSATPSEVTGTASNGTMIDFYANDSYDAGGYYEGKTFLGRYGPVMGGTFDFPLASPDGSFLTATATDQFRNTSEFSSAILVAVPTATGTPPPDDQAALNELTNLVNIQARFLNDLNPRKKPSRAVAQQVLLLELGIYVEFRNLVTTSFTPGDTAFKQLGLRFLDIDTQIEERAAAILKKADSAQEHVAGSAHARAQLRKKIAAVGAQLTSALAQDQTLTGELEMT